MKGHSKARYLQRRGTAYKFRKAIPPLDIPYGETVPFYPVSMAPVSKTPSTRRG